MNQLTPHDFDPYSEKSLETVEIVESLPFNTAFEYMMYTNRIDRTALYEYAHPHDKEHDPSPLVIDADIMATRFPGDLRGIFPEDEYGIEQLKICQVEKGFDEATQTYPSTEFSMSFWTHQSEHAISIQDGVALYTTENQELEPVTYTFTTEAIIGLVSAFVYAAQYDPESPNNAIELADSSITAIRDPRATLIEQLIMTLGNFRGKSTLATRAFFEQPNGSPIVATLEEQEVPDKSTVTNELILSEFTEMYGLPTSMETQLKQNIVSGDASQSFTPEGQQYAEHRSTVLTLNAFTAFERIDPKTNYPRWVSTCATFLKTIQEPMSAFEDM